MRKSIPPFDESIVSKDFTFLSITPLQDRGSFIFFAEVEGNRELMSMLISLVNSGEVFNGTIEFIRENFWNWAKLCPPSLKPKRKLRI